MKQHNPAVLIKTIALIIAICFCISYCILRPASDPDSYYHAAAALAFKTQGHFNPGTSLPFTIFGKLPNDQHYGYHLAQSWFASNFSELKIFQSFLASLSILIFFSFASKLNPKFSIWTLALLISSYGFMTRISIIKSSALSISLYLLFLYSLYWSNLTLLAISVTTFVISHSGFLICFFVLLAYAITNYQDKKLKYILLCTTLSICLGLLLHPENLNYLKFLKFQGLDIALYKRLSDTIAIGEEWKPPSLKTVFYPNIPILIAFIPLLFSGLINFKQLEVKKKFLLVNSLVIFILYLSSIRFIEYLVPSILLYTTAIISDKVKHIKFIVLPSMIFAIFWYPLAIKNQFSQSERKIPAELIQLINQKLPIASTICNLDWTDYPQLLYYLPQYKYLYGSDPRYLAFESPDIYNSLASFITKPNQKDLDNIIEKANCDAIVSNAEVSKQFFVNSGKKFSDYSVLILND